MLRSPHCMLGTWLSNVFPLCLQPIFCHPSKERFLIVLKPNRICLLIASVRGKQIGWLQNKILFCLISYFFLCQHVLYCRILSAMCKALGYTWTFVRVCLQTRNEGRPQTGRARARGSGAGETSKMGRAFLVTIRRRGFILALKRTYCKNRVQSGSLKNYSYL